MRKHRHFICLILGFSSFILFYYKNLRQVILTPYTPTEVRKFVIAKVNLSNSAFLVDTSACKIPNIDPFDKSVKPLLLEGTSLKCETKTDLLYIKDKSIHINWTEINRSHYKGVIKYCKYDVIFRPYNERQDHNFLEYTNVSKQFSSHIHITDEEFVRVKCYSEDNFVIYMNFFSFVHVKKDVEERCKKNYDKFNDQRKERLSVLMLGVDSISRANVMRYMKETRSYLIEKMGAIELLGYNKVADNTFVNIVPMTTGKYVDELPWNESIRWTPMDEYNFIWDNYSANGYRTFYAEDAPEIAIFDFGKSGFQKPPGDYYNRHFSLAMEKINDIWNTNHYCIHGRSETGVVLDYLQKFAEQFENDPYFAFAFITRLTHSYLEESQKADKIYLNFFHSLQRNGNLNDTVLFFYSDHGMRFGDVRETFLGKLEERLPFMFIIFPPWLLEKYPNIYKHLKINAQRLTTPFDIYETLKDILEFKGPHKQIKQRAMSLLGEIPEDRSCDDADILPHWCTCSQHEQIDVNNKSVINVGKAMISKINEDLKNVLDVCEKLSLKSIRYALRVIPSDKVLRFEESKNDVIGRTVVYGDRVKSYIDYQITLQSKPGDGVFEGTLRYDEIEKTYDLVGDISRINKYGKQSHCVEQHHLKKLCYCKTQIE